MFPTKILKLRLSRIAKGKEHLSTQDKLMLVSMESPDLSANFFYVYLKLHYPSNGNSTMRLRKTLAPVQPQLIQLIEDEFISAYDFHVRKHVRGMNNVWVID